MTKNIPAGRQNFFGMQQKSEATAFFRNSKKKKFQMKKNDFYLQGKFYNARYPVKKRNAFFHF